MKNLTDSQIVEKFQSEYESENIKQINGQFRIEGVSYLDVELFRSGLFSVCSNALQHIVDMDDKIKREQATQEMISVLNVAAKIVLFEESETLDSLAKNAEAKKKTEIDFMERERAPYSFSLSDADAIDPEKFKPESRKEELNKELTDK